MCCSKKSVEVIDSSTKNPQQRGSLQKSNSEVSNSNINNINNNIDKKNQTIKEEKSTKKEDYTEDINKYK